jgi:hypothetical protein
MMSGSGGVMGMTGIGLRSLIGLPLIIVLVLTATWLYQQVTRRPQTGG